MDEREKLFFEHDIATPLTNLKGSLFLLNAAIPDPSPEVEEALGILDGNIASLERMILWYHRTQILKDGVEPSLPWPAGGLRKSIGTRIREEEIPVSPPKSPSSVEGSLAVPKETLVVALIGAALTLSAASDESVEWELSARNGFLVMDYRVPGDQSTLDPSRLFRKVHWPSPRRLHAPVDPGLPYLNILLEHFDGSLELVWNEEIWTLEASVPLIPADESK